ncbi:MAG TPA: 3D domain-containing protein [Pseudoneobacillus sp.]|nr:3D domain-containing protein [Pseudoneobacillus sp.]
MRRQLRFVLPCIIAATLVITGATRHATDESTAARSKTNQLVSVDNNSVADIAPSFDAEPMPVQEPVEKTEDHVPTATIPSREVSLSRGGSPNIAETFIANVSAYTPFDPGVGRKTASGAMVQANHTIAMDKKFPMGTKVIIDGFPGIVFVVEDHGGAIYGNKIDVFMETLKEANAFGRQQLRVWILK